MPLGLVERGHHENPRHLIVLGCSRGFECRVLLFRGSGSRVLQ